MFRCRRPADLQRRNQVSFSTCAGMTLHERVECNVSDQSLLSYGHSDMKVDKLNCFPLMGPQSNSE